MTTISTTASATHSHSRLFFCRGGVGYDGPPALPYGDPGGGPCGAPAPGGGPLGATWPGPAFGETGRNWVGGAELPAGAPEDCGAHGERCPPPAGGAWAGGAWAGGAEGLGHWGDAGGTCRRSAVHANPSQRRSQPGPSGYQPGGAAEPPSPFVMARSSHAPRSDKQQMQWSQ
ncbi:hypothetical protein D0Z08_11055 [Nocardioides immobilis]|uniref:Uncharacterized protein n=1 Tax=Nocardioides immobilis TaxID=2049295 RepID=A0A417Y3G0_9ACTN|nr:hypothetical protein D0Z08_11055 [Nocardioides immobilis]